MKKIICALLSLIMIICSVSAGFSAYAEDNKFGENCTYSFDENGKIVLMCSGKCYDNAENILNSAENKRYENAVSEIENTCDEREKTLNSKIAKIVVDGYYQGTDKEYELEIAALTEDMNALNELINNTTDDDEKAQYQAQLKEKQKEYNQLVILNANKKQKDILQAELDVLPEKKQNLLDEALTIHNSNLSEIKNVLKNCTDCDVKPVPVTPKKKAKIKVSSTKITKIKGRKKSVFLSWKRVKGATGYVIQFSTSRKFTKKKTKKVNIKKAKTVKRTVKKLKSKKKYYVRIRAYKKYKGKNYYSNWSKVRVIKTK